MRTLDSQQVKKLEETQNPLRQRSGEDLPTKSMSVGIPDTKEWREIIKELRHNAAEVGGSLGHVIRSAMLEYYDNHAEGNPVAHLDHWTKGEPLSKAAAKKLGVGWGKSCGDCDGTGKNRLGGRCGKCAGLGQVAEGEHY